MERVTWLKNDRIFFSCRYRSLSSAQDLDSASVASLKNIEKNIYYVQSQIELADKQLDDMWYKFCENSPEWVYRLISFFDLASIIMALNASVEFSLKIRTHMTFTLNFFCEKFSVIIMEPFFVRESFDLFSGTDRRPKHPN